jgi:acetyl esterase/lipase
MLVVPGGGYCMVSEREGEPVAIRFLSKGYCTFVLDYSVHTAYPTPLIEAAMAMAFIRENAEKYCIDPHHVAAVGFSAGGHLVGMLATMFDDEYVKKTLKKRAELVRPDAVLLSYAVLETGEYTHFDTANIISGGDEKLRAYLSPVERVTKNSVPAFIWHTVTDTCVPVECSLDMALAYRKANVPFELHVFEEGIHGRSLATIETEPSEEMLLRHAHLSCWVDLSLTWLSRHGFAVHIQ